GATANRRRDAGDPGTRETVLPVCSRTNLMEVKGEMEMRRNKLFMGAMVMSIALVAAGCAKPPQQEVDALKANIASAEAEATKYASEAWAKTTDAMNQVNA